MSHPPNITKAWKSQFRHNFVRNFAWNFVCNYLRNGTSEVISYCIRNGTSEVITYEYSANWPSNICLSETLKSPLNTIQPFLLRRSHRIGAYLPIGKAPLPGIFTYGTVRTDPYTGIICPLSWADIMEFHDSPFYTVIWAASEKILSGLIVWSSHDECNQMIMVSLRVISIAM